MQRSIDAFYTNLNVTFCEKPGERGKLVMNWEDARCFPSTYTNPLSLVWNAILIRHRFKPPWSSSSRVPRNLSYGRHLLKLLVEIEFQNSCLFLLNCKWKQRLFTVDSSVSSKGVEIGKVGIAGCGLLCVQWIVNALGKTRCFAQLSLDANYMGFQ